MAEYTITIKGTIKAKNFDSAERKLDELKAKVERIVEAAEVSLVATESLKKQG